MHEGGTSLVGQNTGGSHTIDGKQLRKPTLNTGWSEWAFRGGVVFASLVFRLVILLADQGRVSDPNEIDLVYSPLHQ